jgi:hypothetical protein
MNNYSADELFKFFSYLTDKGLANPSTVRNWKNVSVQILGALAEEEKEDLRNLNIEETLHRFENLNRGKYKPDSLAVYKTRFKAGIENFISWTENPSNFKPIVATRKSQIRNEAGETKRARRRVEELASHVQEKMDTPADVVFPIPIRPNHVVKISHLPADLTMLEAEKIAAVIKALAMPE